MDYETLYDFGFNAGKEHGKRIADLTKEEAKQFDHVHFASMIRNMGMIETADLIVGELGIDEAKDLIRCLQWSIEEEIERQERKYGAAQ